MKYYSHHIGDFNNATRHLTRVERSLYRDMIELYYDVEQPLNRDMDKLARRVLAHTEEEREAMRLVLEEFFVLEDDGWHNPRCDEEIAKYRAQIEQASRAGKSSAAKRMNRASTKTDAPRQPEQRDDNGSSTPVEQAFNQPITINQEPITNTPPDGGVARKRAARTTKPAVDRPDDVPEPVWQDFQAIRKAKRAPLTDTAMEGIRREAGKAGLSLADAIAYCCEAGWQGFNAAWYADRHARGGRRAQPQSFRERDRQAVAERVAQFSPRIADKAALSDKAVSEVSNVLSIESC